MGFKQVIKKEETAVPTKIEVEWRPIEGYQDCEMSSEGHIRAIGDPDLVQMTSAGGRRLVWLYDMRGRIDLRSIGSLYQETFPNGPQTA